MFTLWPPSGNSIDMDEKIASPTVQRALPNLAGLHKTFGFDSFLASPPPTITSDPRLVREHIRGYAVQLERHERFTDLWKQQYANQLVNLRELITTLDTRCRELEASASSRQVLPDDLDSRLLGLPEFEDLYYFLACKTRTLYSDLQVRFASNFMTMDDVLHHRGSSSYARTVCTVRDLRNFLRAIWFHLLHPVIVRTIESCINSRKYQALKANPLLPSWNAEDLTPGECKKMQMYELGLNLDASTVCAMFEHLDDVSSMSVPALLMKVSQRLLGIYYASSEQQVSSGDSNEWPAFFQGHQFVPIEEEDEAYIQNQMESADLQHDFTQDQYRHTRIKSGEMQRLPNACPPSAMGPTPEPSGLEKQQRGRQQKRSDVPPANNVTDWLSHAALNAMQVRYSSREGVGSIDRQSKSTPVIPQKGSYSLPTSPSSYRIPFHGCEEFPHHPPTPPPKSPSQLIRANRRKVEKEAKMSQREDSRLQDALQQVEILQRENSQLQERLSLASAPKGLFRRLSKARSRSPEKRPRRSLAGKGVS